MGQPSALGWIPIIASLLIAVIGWFIVIANGTRLAIRNETHSLCDSIYKDLNDLIDETILAWEDAEFLPSYLEQDIICRIAHIELKLTTIKNHYFKHGVSPKAIRELRRACTLANELLGSPPGQRPSLIKRFSYEIKNQLHIECYEFTNNKQSLSTWFTR